MGQPEIDERGTVTRAEGLLVRAEHDLIEGRIGAAAEAVSELAALLGEVGEVPGLLGRGLWLAALLSLIQGRLSDFDRNSAAAIDSLELAGDAAGAEIARATRLEILDRIEAELALGELGPAGFLEALHRYAARAIDRAGGTSSWDAVDRDRAHLAQLLDALEARGQPAPMSRLIRGLSLDGLDAVALSLLVPLGLSEELAAAIGGDRAGVPIAGLAALAFGPPRTRAAMIDRLAPGAPLTRYRVVRVHAGELVSVDPAMLWFLRTGRIEAGGLPPGVSWHEPAPMPLADHLVPSGEAVARALGSSPSPVVIVSGDVGAGKTSLVLAAAAAAARPVLVVDVADLTDAELGEAWPLIARDAALTAAVVYLRCERRLPALAPILAERRLSLVLGTTSSRAAWLASEARRVRADIAPLAVASMSTAEQLRAWGQALQELGRELVPAGELAATVCRPGLTMGDIVDGATEAAARADTGGVAVDGALLARVLEDRFVDQLRGLAEVVLPGAAVAAGLRPEVVAWIDAVVSLATRSPADAWALGDDDRVARARVAVRVSGATGAVRTGVVTNLAARLGCPLVRLDTAALLAAPEPVAATHFVDVVSLAARAGALLAVTWREVPALHALGRSLAQLAAERSVMLAICSASEADDLGELGAHVSAVLELEELR